MRSRRWLTLVAVLALIAAGLACGESSDDEDQLVRTLAAPTDTPTQEGEPEAEPTAEIEPTSVPPTPTPTPIPPTPTPEIEGLVPEGTSLVGTDIEPGIYVGLAGESMMDSCYWERLSNLSGDMDAIIANGNAIGLFYVEVLETDRALTTDCELLPIHAVPAPDQPYTEIGPGTYIIGRDIEAGTWKGQAAEGDMCYWERMSCVQGTFDCIITNNNAEGQFFVEVAPSDVALSVDCDMQKVE
jgi:hypothetical protein